MSRSRRENLARKAKEAKRVRKQIHVAKALTLTELMLRRRPRNLSDLLDKEPEMQQLALALGVSL
jgi:hypothetical protein